MSDTSFYPKPTPTCANCKCFLDVEQGDIGKCRRFPPQTFVLPQKTLQGTALMPISDFPTTRKNNWCWEHKATETMQ